MSLFREISTQRPRALSSLKGSIQGLRLRVLLSSRRFCSYRELVYITIEQVKTFLKAKEFFTSSQEKTPKKDLLSSLQIETEKETRIGRKRGLYPIILYCCTLFSIVSLLFTACSYSVLQSKCLEKENQDPKKQSFRAWLSALVQRACQSPWACKIELIRLFLLSLGRG